MYNNSDNGLLYLQNNGTRQLQEEMMMPIHGYAEFNGTAFMTQSNLQLGEQAQNGFFITEKEEEEEEDEEEIEVEEENESRDKDYQLPRRRAPQKRRRPSSANKRKASPQKQDQESEKRPRVDASDSIIRLGELVTSQQQYITSLNQYIQTQVDAHRTAVNDTDTRYRTERETLHALIREMKEKESHTRLEQAVALERETLLKERVNALESQLSREKAIFVERENLFKQKIEVLQTELSRKRYQEVATASQPVNLKPTVSLPIASKTSVSTRIEEKEALVQSIYSWQITEKVKDATQCEALYGFSGTQLVKLHTIMETIREEQLLGDSKSRRGCKPSFSTQSQLLMFMHFFTHYVTMRTLQTRFCLSTSQIQDLLHKTIDSFAMPLFDASRKASNSKAPLVYHGYFLGIQKPLDTSVAKKYLSPVYKTYGFYVHCLHDKTFGKVVHFYTTPSKSVDKSWLTKYSSLTEEEHEEVADDFSYEERMKSKFLLSAKKYRGNLSEFPQVIQCLLALTNFDLEFGNALTQTPSDEKSQDD